MKKVYCKNCKYYNYNRGHGLEPCNKHPFYSRNRNNDCYSYKKKWWLFWIKN
jgi:hypothetical protein